MRHFGQVSRRVVVSSAVLLGTVALLSLIPWRLVAAEPKTVEKQPEQRLVTLKVFEHKNGQPEVVLAAPKIIFRLGDDAKMVLGDKAHVREVQLTIQSLPNEKPVKHLIEAKITGGPAGKTQVVLAAPKIMLSDGNTGKVVIAEADGSEFGVEATVSPVNLPEIVKAIEDGK